MKRLGTLFLISLVSLSLIFGAISCGKPPPPEKISRPPPSVIGTYYWELDPHIYIKIEKGDKFSFKAEEKLYSGTWELESINIMLHFPRGSLGPPRFPLHSEYDWSGLVGEGILNMEQSIGSLFLGDSFIGTPIFKKAAPEQPTTSELEPFKLVKWEVDVVYVPFSAYESRKWPVLTIYYLASKPFEAFLINPEGKEVGWVRLSLKDECVSLPLTPKGIRTTPMPGTYRLLIKEGNVLIAEKSITFAGGKLSIGKVSLPPWKYDVGMGRYVAEGETGVAIANVGDLPVYLSPFSTLTVVMNGEVIGEVSSVYNGWILKEEVEWFFLRNAYAKEDRTYILSLILTDYSRGYRQGRVIQSAEKTISGRVE